MRDRPSRGSLLAVIPWSLVAVAALDGCRPMVGAGRGDRLGATAESDTAAVRRVFEDNIRAIHRRDRAGYLSLYLPSPDLARNGPGGLELGYAMWSARRDSTWPDTLVARDLRLVPVAPGVVYGTYHYRVTQAGLTSEGISERVFVRTPDGWRIAVSTAFGLPAGASPPPLAIVGATVISPTATGITRVPNAVVVVRGGRILCAGARESCGPPAEAEVIDARGAFVSPGIIDAHVHFSQTGWVDGRPDALDVRNEYPYDSTVAALRTHPEAFGRSYLCSGVTGVYDVGGYPWTVAMARGTASRTDMPRVAAVGPLLSTLDYWVNLPDMRQFVGMRDDSLVRATVREQRRMGSAAQKVWYLQRHDSLRRRDKAMIMAAGEEARTQRIPLIVHATQLRLAKDALEAGATVLVHSVESDTVDAELISLARRNNAILIPTLTVREGYADVFLGRSPASRYPLDCVDAATRAKLERPIPESRRAQQAAFARTDAWTRQRPTLDENLRRLHRAGVRIAMGTDAGNPGTAHGPSVYREMEAMQAAGMSATDVFRASTLTAAQAMGLDREIGTIEPGKRADLVIFEADPTADIANARRVRQVVRNGSLYGRAELLPRGGR